MHPAYARIHARKTITKILLKRWNKHDRQRMGYQHWNPQTHDLRADKNCMQYTSNLMYLNKHDLMGILYGIHVSRDKGNMVWSFIQRSKTYFQKSVWLSLKKNLFIHGVLSVKNITKYHFKGTRWGPTAKALLFALIWPLTLTKHKEKKMREYLSVYTGKPKQKPSNSFLFYFLLWLTRKKLNTPFFFTFNRKPYILS